MSDGDDSILHCKCEEGKIIKMNGETFKLIQEVVDEITNEDGTKKTIVREIYLSNTYDKTRDSIRRAVKKYTEKNREAINEYHRETVKSRYHDDPEFREKERERNRLAYQRKKMKELEKNGN